MTNRIILGMLLILLPLLGMCHESVSTNWATSSSGLQLGLKHEYLQLAAVESTSTATNDTSPYDPDYPNLFIPTEPDIDGLKQDTKLFLLYQVAVVGTLFVMPESISKWSKEDKRGNIFRKWKDNVNNLRKDKDDWAINYIGHPYFGSVYYVRARQRGLERQDSFWYAAVMSTLYEYGIEALFEPVSIQDMIFTPVGGAILGEYLMLGREKMKRNISARGHATMSDKVLLFMTDPFGTINKKVNNWFGSEQKKQTTQLELLPMLSPNENNNVGIQLQGVQALYRW